MNKQKKVLITLLAILVAIILYKFLVPVERKRVDKLTYTGKVLKNRLMTKISKPSSPPEFALRTDILNRPIFKSRETKRDLFYAKVQPKPARKEMNKRSITVEPKVNEPPRHQAEIDLSQYFCFGSMVKDGLRAIFLLKGNEIYLAKKEGFMDNKYVIHDIRLNTMTLFSESTNEEITVSFQENAHLKVVDIQSSEKRRE